MHLIKQSKDSAAMRPKTLIKKFEHYFLTKAHEVIIFRFYAVVVGFFVPIFGYALVYADPTSIDYFSHRYLISTYWIGILFLSFRKAYVKKYMAFFATIGSYIFMLWIVWIVKVNHFSPEYTIGFFLSFCSSSILFRNRIDLGIFSVSILSLTALVVLNTPDLEVHSSILLLSMFTIGVVYFIVLITKSYINQQLELLNQTLEEKITERTQLAEQRAKELFEKNQELERFAYVASHDLKAPLRTIDGFVNLLSRKTAKLEDPEIEEYSQFIVGGVSRMKQTVDDLLEYSRVGKAGIKFKGIDLNRLVTIVLNGLSSAINRPDVQINLPPSFPEMIICESRQIEQLFQNLIENAIKFNKSDIKKVKISFEENADRWTFRFKDNGIGIPKKQIKQIFEMFKRLHTFEEFPGTGIGLATCKRIVENHGGKLNVHSVEGVGTTFIFSISKKLVATESTKKVKVKATPLLQAQ